MAMHRDFVLGCCIDNDLPGKSLVPQELYNIREQSGNSNSYLRPVIDSFAPVGFISTAYVCSISPFLASLSGAILYNASF